MSATAIWIMCVVIVVALAAWLVAMFYADRTPFFKHSHVERRRGRVQGGSHVGGGRSVAPRRDGEITPQERPDDPTVPVSRPRGTGPMDL